MDIDLIEIRKYNYVIVVTCFWLIVEGCQPGQFVHVFWEHGFGMNTEWRSCIVWIMEFKNAGYTKMADS